MSDYKPRPGINFAEIDMPKGYFVYRLESYRKLRKPPLKWILGKYDQRMLAICHATDGSSGQIVDITRIANKMIRRSKI